MNTNHLPVDTPSHQLLPRDISPTLAPQRALPAMEGSLVSAQDYVSLATYWHTLMKRRWTIVMVALVVTTIVAIVSFKMQPVYKATARVQVEAETPMIQSIEELFAKGNVDDTYVQTQIQVLKSESLAWKTIEQLNLREHLIKPKKLAKISPDKQQVSLIDAFKKKLTVELTPKTRMLAVSYEDPDPQLAAQVATTLVNNYIDYNFRQKYDATRQASAWMEQQLDELKAKVETSQEALVEYERDHQIISTGGDKGDMQEAQVLSDLSHDLTVAESDRLQKESLYREVQNNREQLAVLVHNDLLQKLEEKLADLRDQFTETVAQYGPKFPKAIRIDEEIQDLHSQIQAEQDRVLARIRKDYTASLTREHLAAAAVNAQKEAVGAQNQLLIQHNILQREFEGNQQLYQSLLQRLKNATVSAGLQSTNIHLVDAALPPSDPVRPKKALNIALGFLAGVVLGVMMSFAREGLDHSVKTAEEVEALLMTPALAVVPLHRASDSARWGMGGGSWSRKIKDHSEPRPVQNVALAISSSPQSTLAEAYRTLRTSILLSLSPNPPKSILITSAQSGEGKTATALNLAQTLAQRKAKVVIVDCDLRKGSIAKLLKVDNEKGVSSILAGGDKLAEAIQQVGESNLWILPSGPVPQSRRTHRLRSHG